MQKETDIEFAIAILKAEYAERRKRLIKGDLEPSQLDNVLSDLECITRAVTKMEREFNIKN